MTEPDIAHVVKEISGARVPPTKVILAQIRDVAVPSKIVSIFWDLKFNFSSPFRIVDVGFYLTKNFCYYRIGNSLYSQDSEPTEPIGTMMMLPTQNEEDLKQWCSPPSL